MSKPIRLALAQIDTRVGDLAGNLDRIRAAMSRARDENADILVLPEMTIPGYPAEDLLLRPGFLAANRDTLETLIPETVGLSVVVGFADASDGHRPYNAAALLQDGRLVGIYRKQELPNYGVFDEARYFRPGDAILTATLTGGKVGVTICEDIWVDDGPAERTCGEGARILLNLSASPYSVGKPREREELFGRLARRLGCHILLCNLVGGQDELVFDGNSMALDPEGRVIARARAFDEDFLVVEIDPDRPEGLRGEMRPPVEGLAESYAALRLGTHDYVRKNGFERVLIGLSGGIDSALTATIAVDALGPKDVVGVTMPSAFSSGGSVDDSRDLCARLGCELLEIPIGDLYDEYMSALAPPFAGTEFGIAEENLQARIRGTLLMSLSNKFGWLVLTTGNKSEIAVGYSTLYGDTAGGFAVLRDLYKTGVYAHARWRNEQGEVIPPSTITKPPSAELRPDQLDTDSLPAYEVLDPILEAYVERDESREEILAHGLDPALVDRILRLVDLAEYKRRQSPPGVKITPRAFGKDRRVPITSGWIGGSSGRRGS